MPYISELTADGTGNHRVGSGAVTGSEMLMHAQQLANCAEELSMLNHVFIDFSEVTSIDLFTLEIQQISAMNRKTAQVLKNVLVAIVAPSDMAYGVSRMYQGWTNITGWEVEVFRSRREAQEWLANKLA